MIPLNIKNDAVALQFWQHNIADIQESDLDTYALMCMVYSDTIRLREEAKSKPDLYRYYMSALSRFFQLQIKFGLNPRDRKLAGKKNQLDKKGTYKKFMDENA